MVNADKLHAKKKHCNMKKDKLIEILKNKMHNSTPRRKRLNRKQRIPIAREWINSYNGKNIVRGYANCFGVDLLCAIIELRIVGQNISEEYESQVRKSMEYRFLQRKKDKEKKEQIEIDNKYMDNWESEFEFIAGYTSNGIPFGIRKDEL